MSINPISTNTTQTCPHGLPPGACSICSGMGGGGAKTKKADTAPKNEMSYAECYAVWMRMKAAERHKIEAENSLQKQAEFMQNARKMLDSMAQKLTVLMNKIENILPFPVNKIFGAVFNNILRPVFNLIKNFPNYLNNISEFIKNIQREVYIAAEKLASVFGEVKNFLKKKVSETFRKFTKKVYKILNIFGLDEEELFKEDEEARAEIAAFKAKDVVSIKEFLISLARTERKPEKDDDIAAKLSK